MIQNQVRKYKDGDDSVRDELIKYHMPIVDSLVGRYICPKHNRDDLREVAYYQLVVSVKKARNVLRDDELTPYIIRRVKCDLLRHVKLDHLPLYKNTLNSRVDLLARVELEEPVSHGTCHEDEVDFMEMLDRYVESEEQKAVVLLRLEGYTFNEIVKKRNSTINQVRKTWNNFIEKYLRRRSSAER